jgi:hypothetical protein
VRFRRYPGLFDSFSVQQQVSESGERHATWAVTLLPEMEQQAVYDEYAKGKIPLPNMYVASYVCPSDSVQPRSGTSMSYVANAGWDTSASNQSPTNGAFLNRVYDSRASVVEGHWKDGKEHTLAFSEWVPTAAIREEYDIIGWNGFLPDGTIDHDVVDEKKHDRTWGPAFVWQSNPTKCSYINGPECVCTSPDYDTPCRPYNNTPRYLAASCTITCNTADRPLNARPASEHGGGVNVAFSSGRALFVRETIDYRLLRALMTLNDKKSNSPDKDVLFDDNALE